MTLYFFVEDRFIMKFIRMSRQRYFKTNYEIKKIINFVAQSFVSLIKIAVTNVSFDNVLSTKLIIDLFNEINDILFIEMIIYRLIVNFLKKV